MMRTKPLPLSASVLVVVTGILVVAGVLIIASLIGIKYLVTAAQFEDAKSALILEVHGLNEDAERRIASEWRNVAGGYLNEFARGRLDKLFDEAARDRRWNDGALAGATAHRVREAVAEHLGEEGDYPISEEMISGRLESDPRIARLYELWDANHAVATCAREAKDAKTMDELREIQVDLEQKKSALDRLLQPETAHSDDESTLIGEPR